MPVDYINIIDVVRGHLKRDGGGTETHSRGLTRPAFGPGYDAASLGGDEKRSVSTTGANSEINTLPEINKKMNKRKRWSTRAWSLL